MRKLLLFLAFLSFMESSYAQDEDEYRMEIGVGAGMMGYLGDFNGNITKDLQPMGGLIARYNINPYMGLRLNVSYGKMKGSSADVETYYPDYATAQYDFDNSLVDFSLMYEYNFFPYGTGRDYRGAKRLTPVIFAGLGATYVDVKGADSKSVFTANVPIGIGLRYKVGKRMNIGVDWAMHFSLNDELDGRSDPYGIKSSGPFKNTDCYSTLQFTLSYSFLSKCKTCHNEDE